MVHLNAVLAIDLLERFTDGHQHAVASVVAHVVVDPCQRIHISEREVLRIRVHLDALFVGSAVLESGDLATVQHVLKLFVAQLGQLLAQLPAFLGAAIYASSKGAVMTYTRSLAKEFGPQGIRVNALCPGMIATKFHDDFTKDQVRVNVAAATPLKREGNAEEVADLVAYLASDESSFLTGNNIDINGGLAFS